MNTEQTLALKLADALEFPTAEELDQAAAELRRLHEQKEHWIEQWSEVINENQTLRNALQALYDTAPSAECSDFHHPKKDRHEIGAPCPVLERYENACLKARAALARAGEKT